MKKCFGLVLAVLLIIPAGTGMTAAAAADGTNLLLNPGFEAEPTENVPIPNWSGSADSVTLVTPGSTGYVESPDGGNYVLCTSGTTQLTQRIEDMQAGNYEVSAYVNMKLNVALNNQDKTTGVLTVYVRDADGVNMGVPQTTSSNFAIYTTRGEWRRVSYIISVPETATQVDVVLRQTDANTSVCYDGASFRRIGDYDETALMNLSMDETMSVDGTPVPTQGTPYSTTAAVSDMSYGKLGVNYKASIDTPDGKGYSLEMTVAENDANVTNTDKEAAMLFFAGSIRRTEVYEVSGWIKTENMGTGSHVDMAMNRIYASQNGALARYTISANTDGWIKFAFKNLRDIATAGHPSVEGADHSLWEENFASALTLRLYGTGTVRFDDIRITKIQDKDRVPLGNLAIGGDFESIQGMTEAGVKTLNGNWTKGADLVWANDPSAADSVMLYTENAGTPNENTCLRVNVTSQDKRNVASYSVGLEALQLLPDTLYKLTWRQKEDVTNEAKVYARIQLEAGTNTHWIYCSDVIQHTRPAESLTEWNSYTQYIRYPATASPENAKILFRPNTTTPGAYYIDDLCLTAVDESTCMGIPEFTEGENNTVAVSRKLVSSGWDKEETRRVVTATYLEEDGKRQLYDVAIKETVLSAIATGKVFFPEVESAATVNVPAAGIYTVESYVWDSAGKLVPLSAKTVMQ